MDKLDLAKTDKAYYSPPSKPVEVSFGALPYLGIKGKGAPMGDAYGEAIEALFTLAYSAKFLSKDAGQDFTVAKLEGQWWWPPEYYGKGPEEVPREVWEWHLLIRQPGFVTPNLVHSARSKALLKKGAPRRLPAVEFSNWDEGHCVQILHVGTYAQEPETLKFVHDYMKEHRLIMAGHHHEIYLSDPRKGDPTKAKTILRIPVKPI